MDHGRLNIGSSRDPGSDLSVAFILQISSLTLDIIREPQGTSSFVLGGAWFTLCVALNNKPQTLAALLEAGMMEVGMEALRQASPLDLISWRTPAGIIASGFLNMGWTLSTTQLPGVDVATLLIEVGFVDLVVSLLKAYEMRGPSLVGDANVCGLWASIEMMTSNSFDMNSAAAQPIVKQLEKIPSALAFVMEHPVSHYTSKTQSRLCCTYAVLC